MTENGSGNGGRLKASYVLGVSAGTILIVAGIIFRAGSTDATYGIRLDQHDRDINEIRADYARRDVVEQRLTNIEASERQLLDSERAQADALQQLLMTESRRGR